MIDDQQLKNILEAALVAAGRPLSVAQMEALFTDKEMPSAERLMQVLSQLQEDYEGRGIRIIEVSTGYRIQTAVDVSAWVSRLWEERPPRYSRALLETLALVAYRQPITRGEIEDVRGVAVSTNIVKTLLERDWIRVVGHRDVPGRPAMYGTTREFLDYFGLKSLDELPTLAELRDIESLNAELDLQLPDGAANDSDQMDMLNQADATDADAEEESGSSVEEEAGESGSAEESASLAVEASVPENQEAEVVDVDVPESGESEQEEAEALASEPFENEIPGDEAVADTGVEAEVNPELNPELNLDENVGQTPEEGIDEAVDTDKAV